MNVNVRKSKLFVLVFLLLGLSRLQAYELTFKATPMALFPFYRGNDKVGLSFFAPEEDKKIGLYEPLAFGTFLDAGITLFDYLNVGPEFGFMMFPKKESAKLPEGTSPNLFEIPIGLQIGTYLYPFSRVEVGLGIAGGASIAISQKQVATNEKSTATDKTNQTGFHYAPWYRAFGEVNFRINPMVSLGLNVSWFDCQNTTYFGNPMVDGLSAGVSVRIKIDTEKVSGKVDGTVIQDESVFPLMYSIYQNNPFGTIIIENNETAEIRNVVVKFRSENYTASEKECGKLKVIKKHKKEEIPLYADFSDSILQFTESGKMSGELVIEYELLGKKRVAVSQVTIPVYNRNQVRWMDSSAIASYISSNSQEVLEFSKYLVGIARSHLRSGLNRNMQFSMYLYEGLRLNGIKCVTNSDTPYSEYHLNPDLLDYIQYPYQTLSYKTGDRDDVGILYMAMLASVGINAAFIPLENDFIIAFDLGVDASRASTLFDGYDRILVVDDSIWIPVSISSLNEGFVNSWYKAIVELQELTVNEEDFEFVSLTDAWQVYPPAGFSSKESSGVMPAEAKLTAAVENDISRYITAEFGPQIAAVQNRIKAEGASVVLYNQLGMLYVRAGMYSSAIPVYELSAKMGSVPAMNNLGNIYTLQKKYLDAKKWYEMALTVDPTNATALKNLDRIITELQK